MKSKEELNALKNEVESLSRKLRELTDEELNQVTGGVMPILYASDDSNWGSEKLPSEPGSYKMGIDIDINGEWIPDPGKTSIS